MSKAKPADRHMVTKRADELTPLTAEQQARLAALAGRGDARERGTRMGVWGAAQGVAFGAGGFLGAAAVDAVLVVTAAPEVQRARVLARPGMTEQTLDLVLSRQLPDDQRRARADWIIPSHSLDAAAAAVDAICSEILSQRPHA